MGFGGRQSQAVIAALRTSIDVVTSTVRRHRPDYLIVLYMGLLMLFGLIIMYAIGPQRANVLNNAYGSNYSDTYFFVKQLVSLGLALGAFIVMAVVPYGWTLKRGGLILVIGLVACVVLAVAGWAHLDIAQGANNFGANRWFNLGALGSLQPAEIVKFGMLVFVAGFLGTKAKKGKVNDVQGTLIPLGIITAIAMLFIVVIQKDLGTGIALTSLLVTMFVVAGISKKIGIGLLVIALLAGVVFIISAPHRLDRITTFAQGDSTTAGDSSSYQIEHAKMAIGSGGLFGVGIGNSVQATGYLPEAINDSVFAIMGETFGFVGLMAILALFIALLMRLLQIMDHLIDIRLKLLVAGVFGWFGAHVILNIASMIGLIPLTGITLPLLSFGGTSMIFIAAALGLVFQLSRYTVHSSRLTENSHEDTRSRRGLGRPRYPSRRSS
jgi:cell division protein FtsW